MIPGMNDGQGFVGILTSGWGVSAISIQQSGYPMTVLTTRAVHGWRRLQRRRRQPRLPERQQLRHEQIARRLSERRVYARTVQRAAARHQRQREDATVPAAWFFGGRLSRRSRTRAWPDDCNFEFRFEFYNLFNYDNLYLSNDLSSGGFGKAISQQLPLMVADRSEGHF